MKKKVVSLIVLVAILALAICGCGSFKKEVTEEEADAILEGKSEVPETLFKTQEEVEALFKAAGLVPKFVVRNFDDTALNYERYLRAGECDEMDDFANAKYYDSDEVGDRYGVYADIGTTIIVGYSDHDFDGTGGKDEEADNESQPEEPENKEAESGEASNDRYSKVNDYLNSTIEQYKDGGTGTVWDTVNSAEYDGSDIKVNVTSEFQKAHEGEKIVAAGAFTGAVIVLAPEAGLPTVHFYDGDNNLGGTDDGENYYWN